MLEILSQSTIFSNIKIEDIEFLLEKINYQIRSYQKDGIISLSGDNCERLLIVIEGSVRGEMVDFSGKTIKIEDIEAPNTVAEAFLFGDNNKLPVNIVSNTDTKLFIIQKDSLLKLFQANPIVFTCFGLKSLETAFYTISHVVCTLTD